MTSDDNQFVSHVLKYTHLVVYKTNTTHAVEHTHTHTKEHTLTKICLSTPYTEGSARCLRYNNNNNIITRVSRSGRTRNLV